VIDPDETLLIGFDVAGHEQGKIGKCESMMLIVICQKCQHRVLVLNLGIKYRLVPLNHPLKATSPIDNMSEFPGANAGLHAAPLVVSQ